MTVDLGPQTLPASIRECRLSGRSRQPALLLLSAVAFVPH